MEQTEYRTVDVWAEKKNYDIEQAICVAIPNHDGTDQLRQAVRFRRREGKLSSAALAEGLEALAEWVRTKAQVPKYKRPDYLPDTKVLLT